MQFSQAYLRLNTTIEIKSFNRKNKDWALLLPELKFLCWGEREMKQVVKGAVSWEKQMLTYNGRSWEYSLSEQGVVNGIQDLGDLDDYSGQGCYTISVSQFSCSVVSNSLWPHGLQDARPPCPSPTPRVYSNSCPYSRWCHPTISSSVVPFSSRLQSFPASGSFQMSQLFAWGGQSIGVSAWASFLPKKSQGWSPSEWTGWSSLQSKGLSRVFSNTTVQKHQFFNAQLSL